jgi:hypothetical protein
MSKLAWLILAWSASSFAQSDVGVPKLFVAAVQPSLKPAHALQLDGTTLIYTVRAGAEVETQKITPTSQQWAAFRRALDGQKVWRWKSKYGDRNTYDAATWSLKIEYADKSLTSAGVAGVPDRSSDRALPKYAFNRYQLALQELIGRPFGRGVKPIEVFDVSELTLVATHAPDKEAEHWADFRDPSGKVHRVAPRDPAGGNARLRKVSPSSVEVAVFARTKTGEWSESLRTLKPAARPGK